MQRLVQRKVPECTISSNVLCLHGFVETSIDFAGVTLSCGIEKHLNADTAIGCVPLKAVAVGGKHHGLVELVNGLEHFCMSLRETTLLDRFVIAVLADIL